eukprot:TRINITY_DN19241_c0_g1_i1.p1 TRINITY_DN19241_c0_g1~~TRINITY_DN19241_c0_g1_i1.p1  ORF type:complete len:410 (+),score=93.77 TRINITY_DN19241_c0_g1_i1:784-2013(+)
MPKRTDYLKSSRKYDIPIYCGAWLPKGSREEENKGEKGKEMIVIGGGGGDRKHGIKNRIIVAGFDSKAEELSEEVFHLSTEEAPPFRLAIHPGGDTAVAAFEKGCRLFTIQLEDEKEKLVASDRILRGLGEDAGEQKFVIFSPDGTRLAAGGEDKGLRVFEWPSMEPLINVEKAHKTSLKDGDFSVDGQFLATTADSGPCHVWDVTKDVAIATLTVAEGAKLGLCRFSRDVDKPFLFTTVVKGGNGWLVVWNTLTWTQIGVKKYHDEPISAFALSPDGSFLATGTAGGDVSVIAIQKMNVHQKVKRAHMVFVTAMDFSPDAKSLLSVSADSSARVTTIEQPPKDWQEWQIYLILLFMFAVTAFLFWIFYHNSQWFWQFPLGKDQPAYPGPAATAGYIPGRDGDPVQDEL